MDNRKEKSKKQVLRVSSLANFIFRRHQFWFEKGLNFSMGCSIFIPFLFLIHFLSIFFFVFLENWKEQNRRKKHSLFSLFFSFFSTYHQNLFQLHLWQLNRLQKIGFYSFDYNSPIYLVSYECMLEYLLLNHLKIPLILKKFRKEKQ